MRDTPYDIPSITDVQVEGPDTLAGSIASDLSRLLLIIRSCCQFLRIELRDSGPTRVYLSELLAAAERATKLAAQLHAISRSHVQRADESDRGRMQNLRTAPARSTRLDDTPRPR